MFFNTISDGIILEFLSNGVSSNEGTGYRLSNHYEISYVSI